MSLLDEAKNKQGNADVTPWKPTDKGDGVEGRVVSVDSTPSDFPSPSGEVAIIPIIVLEQEDGSKVGIRGYHSVLRREIESENPQPGDLMAAVYMGSEPLKTGTFKGRPVHVYRVVVQKSGQGSGAPSSSPSDTKTEDVPF